MKKLKALWDRIPRPCRGLLNLAGIILLAFLFYTSIGGTPLSRAQAFRRVERANFVGPSEILFNEKIDGVWYDNILVAESENGVSTYIHYYMQNEKLSGEFNYFPKTGSITVVSASSYYYIFGMEWMPVKLPVFVIDDFPEAKFAELEISVTGIFSHNYNEENKRIALNHHFSAKSNREQDGIFQFNIELTNPSYSPDYSPHGARGYALDALARTFTKWGRSMVKEANITATVRLYDENGTLITSQTLPLKPPNA